MRFFNFLWSILAATLNFLRLMFFGGRLWQIVQFTIMVLTILLTLLSAIEPIIRLPPPKPPPPPEEPAPKAGYMILDLLDNHELAQVQEIEERLGTVFTYTDSTTMDEGLGRIWVENLQEAQVVLTEYPVVEIAEPELQYTTTGIFFKSAPNDPLYDKQWNMKMVGAQYAWDHTPQGEGVIVAVIDTGVTVTEDLKGTNVLEGRSFVPREEQRDGNGHGTHVAGTIAQTTNNGIGVVGLAPKATILPVKVLSDAGSGSHDWIAAGIYYAIDEGAKVINMSLGGPHGAVVEKAVKQARAKGVVVVCACGNSGTKRCGFPAGYAEAVGVSSLGPDGKLAPYSDHGQGVDIAAPGGNKNFPGGGILQNTILRGKDQYAEFQGTSMASPHVAGAAAVLASLGLDADAIEKTLYDTATNDDPVQFGHGKLNLEQAVRASSPAYSNILHLRPIAAAALLMLALGWFGGVSRAYTTSAISVAVLTTGGLFFLPMLPLPEFWVFKVIALPLLQWPSAIFGNDWSNFPLWLSVLPIGVFAYTVGLHQRVRALTAGLTIGIGVTLLWGALTNTLVPWYMPVWVAFPYLVANALACGFIAMSLTGVQHLEEEHNANADRRS